MSNCWCRICGPPRSLAEAKQRAFTEFRYGAHYWHAERRVIARLKHSEQGENPRYFVTNLEVKTATLYDRLYCARGEMENHIKEAQLGLFADRTSCHYFIAKPLCLLLSSAANIRVERLRAPCAHPEAHRVLSPAR